MLTLDSGNLLYSSYRDLRQHDADGHRDWCTNVRLTLRDLGLSEYWENQDCLVANNNIDFLIPNVKTVLIQNYKLWWEKEVVKTDKHPILRTYITFKPSLAIEPYLFLLKNINYCRALVRFRVSSHRLQIELGRHTKPKTPIEKRICVYCDDNSIDNESHFLIQYKYLESERQSLYTTIEKYINNFRSLVDDAKFKCIMSENHIEVQQALAKYIYVSTLKQQQKIVSNLFDMLYFTF